MSFREKSAWLMAILMAIALACIAAILAKTWSSDRSIEPFIPILVFYVVALSVVAGVGHTAIAILAPQDAAARADERDRLVHDNAAARGGRVFAAGTALSLGHYLLFRDGDLLFYFILASWVAAQFAEYWVQIILYRRAR